jgi:hypothetical protein
MLTLQNMQIIDNFMPADWWESVHNILGGHEFPWNLYKATSSDEDGYQQMVHLFYKDNQIYSGYFSLVQPLIYEFEKQTTYQVKKIDRIKSNLLFNRPITEEQKQKIIHRDIQLPAPNAISLIYYIKDSDGDTVIYEDDGKTETMRIQPKANRAVIFKSDTWHTGELPVKNQSRIVINYILEVK